MPAPHRPGRRLPFLGRGAHGSRPQLSLDPVMMAAKFTVDLSYLPNGSPVNFDAGGVLDPDANTSQFVLRGQFQLLL